MFRLRVEVVKSIISRLWEGPITVNELAGSLGIDWATCEAYLSVLKLAGLVEEIRSEGEVVYRLREEGKNWLFPHWRRILDNHVEISDEKPAEGKVVDLT